MIPHAQTLSFLFANKAMCGNVNSGSELSAVMPSKDHCCVPKRQNNRAKNIADLTFHQLPEDTALRQGWICKIWQDVWKSFKVQCK